MTSALRLIDRATRRRVWASVPIALMIAVVEGAALAMLLPLLDAAASSGADGTAADRLSWLSRLTGVTDLDRLQIVGMLLVFGLLLTRSLLGAGFRWWQLGFLTRGEERLAVELFRRYLHAPYQFHVGKNSAEAIRNTDSSVNAVTRSVLIPATRILTDGAQLLITAAVLLIADPFVTATIGTYFLVVAVGYVTIIGPRTRRLGQEGQRLNASTLQRMQECLVGVKTIQAAGAGPRMIGRFDDERQVLKGVRHRIAFINLLPRLYLEIALVAGGVVVALLMTRQDSRADAVATVGLLLAAAFRTLPSVGQILGSADSIRAGRAAVDDVTQVFGELGPPPSVDVDHTPVGMWKAIRVEGLGYTYPDGRVALEDVSFEIRRGESIGIVGASGAGKTTLVDLLLGFMSPTEGRVLIGETTLDEGNIGGWRERVGYIPQEVFLSDDTLRRNIALGVADDEIDDDRIAAAIEVAALSELVAQLPEGLDTSVGERGMQLSGGQRQRIGIARALYRRPEVLILDEATSALDNITESAINEVLARLRTELTVITIAHRPTTIAGSDRLLLLDAGRLVADGPVDAVIDRLDSGDRSLVR